MPGSSYCPDPDDDRPALGLGACRGGGGAAGGGAGPVQHHGADLLARGAVGVAGAEDDRVGPGAEDQRDGEGEGPLRSALGLLVDLRSVEEDGHLGDPAAGGQDRGEDRILVGEAGLVLRIADGEGERGPELVMDGADLLVVEAVGLGGGDDDGVGPLAEGEEDVQREGADGGGLLDAGDLAAIEGDEDAAHAGGAGDEAGEGDAVLLDAGLVARGAEGELEGARRGRLRDAWPWPLTARGAPAGGEGAAQGGPAGAAGPGLFRRGVVEHGAGRLMSLPGRIGRGDQQDVLALAERDGEVQPEDGLGLGTLVDPGDLDGVQGDEDLGDALPAGHLADDLEPVRGQPRLVGRLVQGDLEGPTPAPAARVQGDDLEV